MPSRVSFLLIRSFTVGFGGALSFFFAAAALHVPLQQSLDMSGWPSQPGHWLQPTSRAAYVGRLPQRVLDTASPVAFQPDRELIVVSAITCISDVGHVFIEEYR